MLKIKVGVFPGKVEEFAVEDGTTVREALDLAGISVGAEQEVKVDGVATDYNSEIPSTASMVLVTKRIKGAC